MNSRLVAINVLIEVFDKEGYSNIALNKELNKYPLNDKDKGLVTEIVYGTIKYRYTIDKILSKYVDRDLSKVQPEILNILRISIYQFRYLDKVPDYAVVNESVSLAKKISIKASKFVNGILRSYLRNPFSELETNNYIEKLCFDYSYPKWMVELFTKQYGKEKTEDILKGLNSTPMMTVRVNPLKISYDEAFNLLEEKGYELEEGYICPEAICIHKGSSIENNELFNKGYITVQDESAMIVSPLMEPEERQVFFDLCSAPGGKTTHLGELLNNTGKVYAFDIHNHKLKLIKDNSERLGLKNIALNEMDSTKLNVNYINSADGVLLDVPCSGLGIIRKKPEIKWSKSLKSLKDLIKIQRAIMDNGAEYLKDGGTLIYSTCTLNKGENEENIKWFLQKHKNFKLEKIFFGNAENIIYSEEGYVTLLPNKYMDGFFVAKLKKDKRS